VRGERERERERDRMEEAQALLLSKLVNALLLRMYSLDAFLLIIQRLQISLMPLILCGCGCGCQLLLEEKRRRKRGGGKEEEKEEEEEKEKEKEEEELLRRCLSKNVYTCCFWRRRSCCCCAFSLALSSACWSARTRTHTMHAPNDSCGTQTHTLVCYIYLYTHTHTHMYAHVYTCWSSQTHRPAWLHTHTHTHTQTPGELLQARGRAEPWTDWHPCVHISVHRWPSFLTRCPPSEHTHTHARITAAPQGEQQLIHGRYNTKTKTSKLLRETPGSEEGQEEKL
jgi:hypothetical protein